MATEFRNRELPEWAERTYLRGRELAKNETEFAPQLIQLYTQSGQNAQADGRNPAPGARR